MPATIKCYEADFGELVAIPQISLPDNWLYALADNLLATGLADTGPNLKQELDRHAGELSSFTFKNELRLELEKIVQRFMAQGEQELNKNKKTEIALQIQEGINQCTPGFYNRIILINQSFSIPNTLKALLTKIRHNIVNKAAITAIAKRPSDSGNHVHLYNHFFLVGFKYFGVQMVQEFDPHSGNMSEQDIYHILLDAFKAEFDSPLHIIINLRDLIKSILEEQYYYTGRKTEGCITADANHWASYLEKIGIPYDSCFEFKYPYANEEDQAALVRVSSSPQGKSMAELQSILNNHNGIIFYNNSLFYTDFLAESKDNLVQILYEFSEDEDEDSIKIKEQFLALPLDANPHTINCVPSSKLEEVRSGLGMKCRFATLVDLNWQKINTYLFNLLLQENYLSPSLNGSEEFMLKLFKEEAIDLEGYIPLLVDEYLENTQEFLLFLNLFPNLSLENQTQLVQLYLRYLPQEQKYSIFFNLALSLNDEKLLTTVLQEELRDLSQDKIKSEINKLPPSSKQLIILKLHSLTRNTPLYDAFKVYIKNSLPDLSQMIKEALNNGKHVFPTLSLIDCLEVDQKLVCIEELINSILTFNSPSIAAIFKLQNSINKNTLLLYIGQQAPVLIVPILTKLAEHKDILKEDLCSWLLQLNSTNQNVLHFIPKTNDPEVHLKFIRLCSLFPFPLQLNIIEQWMCGTELHQPSNTSGINLLLLSIKNRLVVVANALLKSFSTPELIQTSILTLLNTHDDLFDGSLMEVLSKHNTTNLNNSFYPNTGNYSLHLAVLHAKSHEIMILLCQGGADITKANNSGKTPLDLAIEFKQFAAVKLMFEHSTMIFTGKQAKQIKSTIIQSGELYLLKYFLEKSDRDIIIRQRSSLFGRKPKTVSPTTPHLSWQQFDYMLTQFNTKNSQNKFFKLIDQHVSHLGADNETKQLIKTHAKACCNYLRETKGVSHGLHQSHISKLFLKQILCENKTTKNEIEHEALSYMRGTGVYKSILSRIHGSGYSKFSRLAFAYDLGLFKKSVTSFALENFAEAPKEVRQFFNESVKLRGSC
jgi:hypothetical protein